MIVNESGQVDLFQAGEDAALDVKLSVESSRSQMEATVDVSKHAIEALGRIDTFRAAHAIDNLGTIDHLLRNARGRVSPEATRHHRSMEKLYLEWLEGVESKAATRVTGFSDWTPPEIGKLRTLFRLLREYRLQIRERRSASVHDTSADTRSRINGHIAASNDSDPEREMDRTTRSAEQREVLFRSAYGSESSD